MIKKITTELIWLLSVFCMSIICLGLLVGFNNLTSNETYDLSISTAYFVINAFDLKLYLFVLLGFVTYLFRVIIKRFTHEPSNIILLLLTLYIVFIIWTTNN
jgi:hypothetical protein